MKLATYRDGSRDGQLVVVSRDGVSAHYATGIATRLQQVLDDWNYLSPQLQDLYETLSGGKARHAFAFAPAMAMAPLPRVFLRIDGGAFLCRAEREARAAGRKLPDDASHVPAALALPGDALLGPCEDLGLIDAAHGADLGPALAAITGDVPMGVTPASALEGVRLLMLVNEITLQAVADAERARGAPVLQSRPSPACAPFAITPDELGDGWRDGRVHASLSVHWNDRPIGRLDTADAMHFGFGELIAHAARTKPLRAGCIVGSGVIAARDDAHGVACLADRRHFEQAADGSAKTGWLSAGDHLRIELKGRDGQSPFGAIDQRVVASASD